MMRCIKNIILWISVLLLNLQNGWSQADTVWMTTQGGLGSDQWNEVVLCHNGDLLVAGTTSSDLANGNEVYLARLDSLHHCIWTRTLGAFGVEMGHDVIEDSVGNIWCLATVNGANTEAYDVLLLRFDEDGVMMDQLLFEKEGIQFGQKLAFDGHHQLAITGVEVNAAGGRDVLYYLMNTETLAHQYFSVLSDNQNLEITVTEYDSINAQWLVAGNALMDDSVYQVVGWGVDTLGNIVWEHVNDAQSDSLRVFDAVWKNNYWVLAACDWIGDNWRAQIVKWTPGQSIEKMGSFALTGAETLFHSVVHRSTGNGFVFGGWTYDMGAGLSDAYVHAFDDDFNWDGGAIFGGNKEDKINALVNDLRGKLHWVGMNGSYNAPMQMQGWVARLNAGFVQSSNIHTQIDNDDCFDLSVENSTADESLQLNYSSGLVKFSAVVDKIEVFDVQGKRMSVAEGTDHLSVQFSPGCYLIQWQMGRKRGIQKFVFLD